MQKFFLSLVVVIAAFFVLRSVLQPVPCGAACAPQLATVQAQAFNQAIAQPGAVILDVRTPEEFASGHLADATNLDFNNPQFAASLDKLDKSTNYLIYCRTGNRSGQALKLMEQKGFANVTNLEGGIQAWQAAGLPVVQ